MKTEKISGGGDSAAPIDLLSGQNLDWIAPLAEPYLRGYKPVLESGPALAGYHFVAPKFSASRLNWLLTRNAPRRRTPAAGFFVGFLREASRFNFLRSQPPECLVFCWIGPVSSTFHRRLVQAPESVLRQTAEYIRWLTHRPPRFEFFPEENVVLVRHVSIRDWPAGKLTHFSRNFFIETLCWLVRSALVRRLFAEPSRNSAVITHSTRQITAY